MAEVLIRTEKLSKRYGEGAQAIHVLEELDFVLHQGERIAIIGESGVGKSTLLHILGTLDQPSEGKVFLNDQDLFALSESALAAVRNQEIGFVFQLHHLLPDFSAVENVMMPGLIAGADPRQARERADDILRKVGLGARLTHRPGELSGGEQQRVAIARALVMGPRVVLADEPTGNLDPATGEEVLHLLLTLNREMGTAMAVVTHSERLAAAMDRTLRLKDGKLMPVTQPRGISSGHV